jgi:hypothetical protein
MTITLGLLGYLGLCGAAFAVRRVLDSVEPKRPVIIRRGNLPAYHRERI